MFLADIRQNLIKGDKALEKGSCSTVGHQLGFRRIWFAAGGHVCRSGQCGCRRRERGPRRRGRGRSGIPMSGGVSQSVAAQTVEIAA